MGLRRLLVANRGEIAIRICRAAAELGIETVAVHPDDDGASLHVRRADQARRLPGAGAAAYLDVDRVVDAAVETQCDAVHPGYGFLSESEALARACAAAGLRFVGPAPETLALFGDKARARHLAVELGVPVLPGTGGPTTVEEATRFLAAAGDDGAIVIKAVAGGGGRGMRVVRRQADVEAAWTRCRSEALSAFGQADVYVERLLAPARHIEVQVLGDGQGSVTHLGDRECTLQRRHQKLIEIAPAPWTAAPVRDAIAAAALAMAEHVGYEGAGTFEFLVDGEGGEWFFMEANARLQVEHTVTEEVTGVDIVQAQLRLAGGARLDELGLGQVVPRGFAVQARVNMETMGPDGSVVPGGGRISVFEMPSGPGIRVDTYGYAGYTTSPRYDSLLAKVIAHAPSAPDVTSALARAAAALDELRVDGVPTNAGFLRTLLRHPEVRAGLIDTSFVDEHIEELLAGVAEDDSGRPAEPGPGERGGAPDGRAGARIDAVDPLAVLAHGQVPTGVTPDGGGAGPGRVTGPEGTVPVSAPVQGTVVTVDVGLGDPVAPGQQLLVMEAMKMEHVVAAAIGGVVRSIDVAAGDTVFAGHALLHLEPAEVEAGAATSAVELDPDHIRPDLAEVLDRHAIGLDDARPDAVARRRKTGQRTARENVNDLCDEGTFLEYGPLVIAAQRRRRPVEELIERTPADGMVAGIGSVNGALFGPERSQCVLMSYDYTVLAGTQGLQNHRKKDRMFELAEERRLPVVFFTEGGGGRPGDTDGTGVAGLDCMAFHLFGRLSGLVPLVGISSGRCFAGNAAILGCCDVVIATEGSNIGMGGPAMIEGGGLGVFRPDEVGPLPVQLASGVVDIAVKDEAEAVDVARRYLSYFQGPVREWECADQRRLRTAIPENRLRIYDVRAVIETLADSGSVLELRRHFGLGMVTALIRIEGRPMGLIANDPAHLAGAIDRDGSDKAARFMQLCDAFDLPLLFLCDTPGIMVGPEAETTGLVRHASRLFVTGSSLTVPFFTIVLRKAYGLGAQAMAGGSFKAPHFAVSWPTGEFGGMGLEGAVKLGYRNELAAIDDPHERRALFEEMVARMYQHGKAINTASHFEIDDVIDPVDSRRWILGALRAAPAPVTRAGKKRPMVDTW